MGGVRRDEGGRGHYENKGERGEVREGGGSKGQREEESCQLCPSHFLKPAAIPDWLKIKIHCKKSSI
jgi:hypothetical protein